MSETLAAAMKYHESGLPITLCHAGAKVPYLKGWPEKDYTKSEIKREFNAHKDLNVGIVLGPRSNMIDIEYDKPGGERAVLELFDGDVPVTPKWLSERGAHRVFRWHPDLDKIGKADFDLGPLEIRLGAGSKGAQSLFPPSTTEERVKFTRKWGEGTSIDDCDPAPLNKSALRCLIEAGTAKKEPKKVGEVGGGGIKTANDGCYRDTENIASVHSVSLYLCNPSPTSPPADPSLVLAAIQRTLPSEEGYRHRSLFNYARHLKAIPELAEADLDALLPYVQEWHSAALPYIRTQDFDESWADFAIAWSNVKFPAGQEPIRMIYEQAIALRQLPRAAEKYKNLPLRRLVLLCRQLQHISGEQPFYLGCRTAGELLGVNHVIAAKFLKLLVYEHILEVAISNTTKKATRYRYLGD